MVIFVIPIGFGTLLLILMIGGLIDNYGSWSADRLNRRIERQKRTEWLNGLPAFRREREILFEQYNDEFRKLRDNRRKEHEALQKRQQSKWFNRLPYVDYDTWENQQTLFKGKVWQRKLRLKYERKWKAIVTRRGFAYESFFPTESNSN